MMAVYFNPLLWRWSLTYKREKSGQRPFVAIAPFFYPSGIVSDIIENKKKSFAFACQPPRP